MAKDWCCKFLLIILPLLLCTSCSTIPDHGAPPLQLRGDQDSADLNQAIEASLSYLHTRPAKAVVNMGNRKIPVPRLINTLTTFQTLLAQDLDASEMKQAIREQFILIQPDGNEGFSPDPTMLVTAYFRPVFEGSLARKEPYLYPLYRIPPDLVVQPAQGTNKQRIGRFDGNRVIPYWTREEIETGDTAAGSELVWLKDPLDVFFLHVQGSGLIRLTNGRLRPVRYAGKNGHPYRSIGKYMVQTGRMALADAGMKTIRTYIDDHPQERQQILFTNPSYIFFTWGSTSGAIGNLGRKLTPGRSIAVDQKTFPAGGLAFLTTREPVTRSGKITGWQPVHRFVLAQDTGSAIRGSSRVDLFQGTGKTAGLAAGVMKEPGTLHFLLVRTATP